MELISMSRSLNQRNNNEFTPKNNNQDVIDSLGKMQIKTKHEKHINTKTSTISKFVLPVFLILIIVSTGFFVLSSVNFNKTNSNYMMNQNNSQSSSTDSNSGTEFYALAYHWGFVFYNRNLQEIQNITVKSGSQVQIHLLSASELTQELHEQIEQRDQNNSVGMKFSQSQISAAMDSAESHGLIGHGLAIMGSYMMDGSITTNNVVSNATSMQSLVSQLQNLHQLPTLEFTANHIGTFSIYCRVPCGTYHSYMYRDDGFIVV